MFGYLAEVERIKDNEVWYAADEERTKDEEAWLCCRSGTGASLHED